MIYSKSISVFVLLLLWGAIALFISGCALSEPELIPRIVLFGNPVKISPRISLDGKMMAYTAPVKNVLNVWVKTIGKDDDRAVTKDEDRGIHRYFWAADSKHIIYLQDVGGNENWRLYAVDLETNQIKDLTPYEEVQVQIIARDKHFPSELLIGMNKEDPKVSDVYHLDLLTGKLELVAKNPGNITSWLADADFKIRGAMASTSSGGYELLVWENEQADWQKLFSWEAEDGMTSWPVSFTKDGKSLYLVDSRNVNAGRLVKMEIKTGNIEVIAEDPQYDVGNVMIHPDSYQVQAVSFFKARTEWTVFDESIKDDFKAIAQLDHGDFTISSDRDNADKTWLVRFNKDNGPISYFAYDREKKKGTFLFDHMPELNKYRLARTEPIFFTARDGLTIHGYITFPVWKERKNLSMVLFVHGGPYYRDIWGYDPRAQLFANRGYVCLKVNFRGSTGYGKAFVNAGDKEWGGKMHDDLVDAANWAVKKGYADPERIAIVGGSYGGYAALVGATFTPDVFSCAVDIFGPSNLVTHLRSYPPYYSAYLAEIHKRIGNPDTEEEFLKSRSPLFKVDQIKIPILIGQGANDVWVKQAESEQIVEAMKKKGLEYEYILFEDEGHGFAKPENRLEFFAAAEKFLAKHLGGRYEKAVEDSDE